MFSRRAKKSGLIHERSPVRVFTNTGEPLCAPALGKPQELGGKEGGDEVSEGVRFRGVNTEIKKGKKMMMMKLMRRRRRKNKRRRGRRKRKWRRRRKRTRSNKSKCYFGSESPILVESVLWKREIQRMRPWDISSMHVSHLDK